MKFNKQQFMWDSVKGANDIKKDDRVWHGSRTRRATRDRILDALQEIVNALLCAALLPKAVLPSGEEGFDLSFKYWAKQAFHLSCEDVREGDGSIGGRQGRVLASL
jgi:hypothetical protein